jgi:hypothetical protein
MGTWRCRGCVGEHTRHAEQVSVHACSYRYTIACMRRALTQAVGKMNQPGSFLLAALAEAPRPARHCALLGVGGSSGLRRRGSLVEQQRLPACVACASLLPVTPHPPCSGGACMSARRTCAVSKWSCLSAAYPAGVWSRFSAPPRGGRSRYCNPTQR